ncbi:MAG: hypothetical protein LBT95_05900 [Treponema sp.]|nr:hypothetical protein [Treponema sp.]
MGKERFLFFTAFFFIILVLSLPAQEEDEPGDIPVESDWSEFMPALYTRGDQTFNISLGPIIPVLFLGPSGTLTNNAKLGGTGSLAYNYFLGPHVFVGGELGIMYCATLAKNNLFMVPFGLRIGYQWIFKRFEFPLTLMAGGIPRRYQDYDYFGLIIKPSASAFFRFNTDWSFGLSAAWWWVPEWTSNKAENVNGNFLDIILSARYHF